MREIHIDLSSDYYLQQPKVFGGYVGEHNESKLIVKLPNRMIRDDISYYYFEFQTAIGEHITSPNVYKNTLSADNAISIVLWEQLSPAAGNLKFCVNAINIGKNGAVTIKGKTPVCTLYISESPTGEDVLIDSKSSKEELQKSIDSALKEAKDSGEFKGDKGDPAVTDQTYSPDSENAQSGKAVAEAVAIEQKRSDNTFANALKSSKSGSAILIDDISPVTHEMSVKISSDTVEDLTAVKVTRCGKNLIPFPYNHLPIGITTLNGIEFTVYEDGSILMNGTATTGFSRYLYGNKQDLLGLRAGDIITGSKWVSDDSQTANFNLTFNYYNIDGAMKQGVINLGNQQSLTTTITEDYVGWGIYIYISSGKTFDNLLFKPQLELGKTATDYEPYVEPTEYTPNADGTVHGVTSLYPNTTLTTDTDGVIIDCEYNKDINKFSGADVDVPTKTSELINDSNFATQDYVDEEIAKTTLGGHYETVVEEIWQRNKIFTPVSFDYENQVITVSEGDLDEYSIGDKIYCIIVPNISGCTLNSLSGRLNTKTLTVLSATELSVSDALHADTTVANFHFETVANYFLLAKNLSAKKIRVTVDGASSVPNSMYNSNVFFGITAGGFYVNTVGYVPNSLPLRSSMRLETEIISPYTIFNQFSIGYNCASANPNYHWKNNGAAWATGYSMADAQHKQYAFNGDGTKIENLWRTACPWHCNENGQARNGNPYGNTTLHICNGTYLKIERWVE